mmetsp:Transcript_8738/g.24941  ORF Transcript_8738/g.24941 Transcript_8738/m.24941 type:complete len:351 (+) Transcript_8738:68-1120(+)
MVALEDLSDGASDAPAPDLFYGVERDVVDAPLQVGAEDRLLVVREGVVGLGRHDEARKAFGVHDLEDVAAEPRHLVVGDLNHGPVRPQIVEQESSLPRVGDRVGAHDRDARADRHDHVGVVHGLALPVVGVEGDEPVVANLLDPGLRQVSVAPLGDDSVSDLVCPVQHESPGPLEEDALALRLFHDQLLLVAPQPPQVAQDVLPPLPPSTLTLHGISHQSRLVDLPPAVGTEPVVGEHGVGRAVSLAVVEQVDLETELILQHVAQALVLPHHGLPHEALFVLAHGRHEVVVHRCGRVVLECRRCDHENLVRALLPPTGRRGVPKSMPWNEPLAALGHQLAAVPEQTFRGW